MKPFYLFSCAQASCEFDYTVLRYSISIIRYMYNISCVYASVKLCDLLEAVKSFKYSNLSSAKSFPFLYLSSTNLLIFCAFCTYCFSSSNKQSTDHIRTVLYSVFFFQDSPKEKGIWVVICSITICTFGHCLMCVCVCVCVCVCSRSTKGVTQERERGNCIFLHWWPSCLRQDRGVPFGLNKCK